MSRSGLLDDVMEAWVHVKGEHPHDERAAISGLAHIGRSSPGYHATGPKHLK